MVYKEDYFGFVYIWYDKHRRMFAIGSHYGSMHDNYISSTGWIRHAYKKRPSDFKRRILYILKDNDKKLLLQEEQRFLDKIKDNELGKRYYNLKKTASGGNGHANRGKNKVAWNKGITAEMLTLRRSGLFCLLIDKPKQNKGYVRSEEHKATVGNAKKEWWKRVKSGEIDFKPTGNKSPRIKKQKPPKEKVIGTQEWKDNISRKTKGRKAWNKGLKNSTAADNGKKGADKMRQKAIGRKRKYLEDGTWTWEYPNKKDDGV